MTKQGNVAREVTNTGAFSGWQGPGKEKYYEMEKYKVQRLKCWQLQTLWIVLWERPQCVPTKSIAGYQQLRWGGEREGKKKEVYSYKLPNGNFSRTLLAWQKRLGCLMAAFFTAQQTPGFPSYMSFSSLHCDIWKW